MDMFDLFREPQNQNPENAPASNDSPPISSTIEQNSDSNTYAQPRYPSTLPPATRYPLENSLVIGVPGFLVFRKHSFQLSWLTQLAKSVENLRGKGWKIAVVVGESLDVKAAAHAARQLGISPTEIEQASKTSSQLHASLVLATLAEAHPTVCETVQETISLLQEGKVPVMLGSKDHLSTEARAAMLAETISAKFVLFTDMDVPTNTITHGRFSRMAGEAAFKNKQEFIVDPLTALVLSRSRVETFLLSEKQVSKVESILYYEVSVGTRITSSVGQPTVKDDAPDETIIPRPARTETNPNDYIPSDPDNMARRLAK